MGRRPPHGLVLEAEAGAGAVDTVTGTAVVQQAGGGAGGRLMWATGPPAPGDSGLQAPSGPLSSGEEAGPSLTLGLTFFCSSDRAPNHLTEEEH